MNNVKNIILDFGGVLYDIDIDRMIANYRKMLKPGVTEVNYSKEAQHDLFDQLDRGTIDIESFAQGMKDAYELQGTTEEVLTAWNSLLDGMIPGRQELVRQLTERYPLALLSNTNRFHYRAFIQEAQPVFDMMDRCFFSFDMGLRKPDAEIFHQVLDEMGWKAEETLFVDDSAPNIEGAKAVGLQTCWTQTHADFNAFVKTYVG